MKDDILKIRDGAALCAKRTALINRIGELDTYINKTFMSDDEYKAYIRQYSSNNSESAFSCLDVFLFFCFPFIGWIIIGILHAKKSNEEERQRVSSYKMEREEHRRKVPKLKNERTSCATKLSQLEAHMRNLEVCIIPQQYWDVADELVKIVNDRRADTLEAAIDKYLTESKR